MNFGRLASAHLTQEPFDFRLSFSEIPFDDSGISEFSALQHLAVVSAILFGLVKILQELAENVARFLLGFHVAIGRVHHAHEVLQIDRELNDAAQLRIQVFWDLGVLVECEAQNVQYRYVLVQLFAALHRFCIFLHR